MKRPYLPHPSVQAILIVDLEATTSEDESIPRHEMETIEIGAVLVGLQSLSIIKTFQTFVKPIKHPILTDFCKSLTQITQEMVDQADGFEKAMYRFYDEMLMDDQMEIIWGSWGLFDRNLFMRDCELHHVTYRLPTHVNLKNLFSMAQGFHQNYGMSSAIKKVGLILEGNHHRALDDALNTSKLLPWILGKKSIKN
jgi:3'-5' exoribonuclease 1